MFSNIQVYSKNSDFNKIVNSLLLTNIQVNKCNKLIFSYELLEICGRIMLQIHLLLSFFRRETDN